MDGERLTCHLAGDEKQKSPPIVIEVQRSASNLQSHSAALGAEVGEGDGSGQDVPEFLGLESHRIHALCATDSFHRSERRL